MPESGLIGRRVLVVEDEYYLADELECALRAAGALVLGPVPSVEAALDLLERDATPDAVVLDVNLGGEMGYPVAEALLACNVPVLLTTGYDAAAVPERFAAIRRVEKPADAQTVLREVEHLLGTG